VSEFEFRARWRQLHGRRRGFFQASPKIWVQRMMALSAMCGLLLVMAHERHQHAQDDDSGAEDNPRPAEPPALRGQATLQGLLREGEAIMTPTKLGGVSNGTGTASMLNGSAGAGDLGMLESANSSHSHGPLGALQMHRLGPRKGKRGREGSARAANATFHPPTQLFVAILGHGDKPNPNVLPEKTSLVNNLAPREAGGAELLPVPSSSGSADGTGAEVDTADWRGTWYTVVSGDTLTAIANRYHVPMPGILAINNDSIQSADTINVGQKLRIPSEQDARRLAGLPPAPPHSHTFSDPTSTTAPDTHTCNYALNPSFEEAADDFGLALASVDSKQGRRAFAWKGLDSVSPGPHYVRDTSTAHSGSASLRMQCLR